ncbi:hypothetical protein EXU57_21990 [Segetibacter sp. 3557_3]|uniref:LytTR family transcriptional regulator DNA-binding domain-containing protein n=1 Tax=Segetibacter sp. 3557_3 TaxID=2547429 RepID=UPI0010590418|nr:LytTR family transcriptional regulator DNA-binding domain-containing protein [Segetibacter sp. 3557_3]TDH19953.1 hypothetical protein EXU57_21990 [Segetibacter sp. 3557_3]
MMEPVKSGSTQEAPIEGMENEFGFSCQLLTDNSETINSLDSSNSASKHLNARSGNNQSIKDENNIQSNSLLRLSVKDGEYTYAKADDIIMIESSDHLTIVHVARQSGKVKRTIRNTCLKDFIAELPVNYFLRVNRFCAINLKRLSGGSYHGQYFEFDHCIVIKPKRPIAHAIFNSIGK